MMAKEIDYKKECFVFVDHSNLWIAGQYLQGRQLRDSQADPRYRVDLGRLLDCVTEGYDCLKRFIYGSESPFNDSFWSAARKEAEIKTFHVSCGGGEKEVDVTMACDVMEILYTEANQNSTLILVTGDRDLKPPVERVLKKGIAVQLWSWEHNMSSEYVKLAKTEDIFSVHELNEKMKQFSYINYRSKEGREIDAAHALVFQRLPRGEYYLNAIGDSVARLMCVFFITSRDFPSEGFQDLIVEFPKTKIGLVKDQLKKYGLVNYCSYTAYKCDLLQEQTPLELFNRFEALSGADDEVSPEAFGRSLSIDSSKISDMSDNGEITEDQDDLSGADDTFYRDSANDDDEDGDAASVLFRGNWINYWSERPKKCVIDCANGIHCRFGSACMLKHTEYEKMVFRKFPTIKFKYWKAEICRDLKQHRTKEQRKWCAFAHDNDDSWCLTCGVFGHLKINCDSK